MPGGPGGAPAGPSTGGGATATNPSTRGPSATRLLEIDWDYPVYSEEAAGDGGTVARRKRNALAADAAFAYIAGDDPRPLLVIRECKVCNGTDRALLRGGGENERTMLLARWFHCVKLPMDVREEDHPFYALFPLKDAEHLFVATRDGAQRLPLESEGSRVKLWDAMTEVVEAEYEKKPGSALKKIARTLDQFDVLDTRRMELMDRRDELLETEGQNSRKLKKVLKDLAGLDEEMKELTAELEKASKLELKEPVVAPPEGEGTEG